MKRYLILILICISSQLFSQENSDHLIATIIGSGSPKYNTERSGPSVLISYKNTKILVDMGNGTQANLYKFGIKINEIDALLFTHHHLDHDEEFVPIFIQELLGGNKFEIAGPKPTEKLTENTLELYKEDINYRLSKSGRTLSNVKSIFTVRNLNGGESFPIGNISISCTPVNHTITTLAYRFNAGEGSIVISGDLTYSESLPKLAKNADYLIMDSGGAIKQGGTLRKNGNKGRIQKNTDHTKRAHVNLDESSRMAKEANVGHLVLTHFTFTHVDEDATTTEIRKNYDGTILYAKDLMTIPMKEVTQDHSIATTNYTYPIVDTNVKSYFSNTTEISPPAKNNPFYGQDATYSGNQPSYTNNGDGTITDNITGLMWQQDMGEPRSWSNAMGNASKVNTGGYTDWRMPTIKELYSLIYYTGQCRGPKVLNKFIDTKYFNQPLGDTSNGGREIDAQTWSSTEYLGITMRNDESVFGVNFVDGRVKAYPKVKPNGEILLKYARYVRGNPDYGKNHFVDNNDGTVTDLATGLMWQKRDDGKARNWEDALAYAENMELANHSDWRLPNAKELQSIVDYSRSPQAKGGYSPAVDPIFDTSKIKDSEGNDFYPYFWTSTTLLDGLNPANSAVYIAFGRALGDLRTPSGEQLFDVHGAGAVRSDPKNGNPQDYPSHTTGFQGDVQYVYNYVRCVRNIKNNISVENQQQQQQSHQKTKRNQKSNPPLSFATLLGRMDSNKDGKISKSEVKGKLKENFDQRDTNKDGYITEDELRRKKR